jgi:hypothetical protein
MTKMTTIPGRPDCPTLGYTGDVGKAGRLDRFVNLFFSTIVGLKADEFRFKGMGSELAHRHSGKKFQDPASFHSPS